MRGIILVAASMAVLAACSAESAPAAEGAKFEAEIRRTAFGVPHIKAANMGGIGYGYGYASAQDNVCEIADRLLTVSGERAKYLGPGENDANIASDLYHRRMIASGRVEALLAGPEGSADTPSAEAKALADGYAAGFNRYLRETGVDKISDPRCKGRRGCMRSRRWISGGTCMSARRSTISSGRRRALRRRERIMRPCRRMWWWTRRTGDRTRMRSAAR